MENTEVEKSPSSEETTQLNRNRSFKSKQLVRSQAIRETHSPPRALSPAHPTNITPSPPKITNSLPNMNNSTPINNIGKTNSVTTSPSVGNSSSSVGNSSISVGNSSPSVGISSPSVGNLSPSVGNSSPSVGISSPSVGSSSLSVGNSSPSMKNGATEKNDVRTVSVNASEDSSHVSVRCSDVINSSDVKHSDSDEFKKKLPVEIQITSGSWDDSHAERHRTRRWHSEAQRDLLSNNPRVSCVCGNCTACVHCRGRRRRHYCATKQDSGIVCPDDCPDSSDNDTGASNSDTMRKSNSLDVDEPHYCRCPERKPDPPRPKNPQLSRNDSDDRYEPTGPELVAFIKDTLNKNMRDRMALLKIERELHALVNDTGRCIVRFPVMTSYGRMLVHRCAALFQLSHHLDMTNKTSVLVSKSGTSGGRIPCTSFKEWCTVQFPPSPQRHQPDATHAKSILKRDSQSMEEPGVTLASYRSKSLEQREKEYERVRRRIFSSQDEAQWPWLTSGPIKLLTAEGRNKLLKVQSLEGSGPPGGSWRGARGPVSKSHSFGGYTHADPAQPRVLSRQGDLASSSWRLSPSSSGYKTLSLRSTDSVTPSPTGGASPEPCVGGGGAEGAVVWCVTDMSAVPPGAMVIHPQTGRPLTNPDGSIYQFDPANPPVLYDPGIEQDEQQKLDSNNEKRRGRLEKQHSFIDNDCDCQPSDECRGKCCCECRRHDASQGNTAGDKEQIPKPVTPIETNTQTSTNAQDTQHEPTNQQQETYEPANQQPVYEPTNHKAYEPPRTFEPANQNAHSNMMNNRPMKLTNEGQDMQYAQYQGYRTDELTSPQQMANHYVSHDVNMQVMQHKMQPMPMPDPNMRAMPLSNMGNMVYQAPMPQPYPYPCRVEPSLQMYPPVLPPEEQKLAPSPHPNETAFRIDPSYPYAAVDYTGCGACVDTSMQRSYSVGYGQVEVGAPVLAPHYPVGNVLLPQPHVQPYPQYQEQVPWQVPPGVGGVGGVGTVGGVSSVPHKLVVPELYPLQCVQYPPHSYPHYNIVYPQVIQQPYPICQPMYPVMEKQPEQRNSKHNSISNSACQTPFQDDKAEDEKKSRQNNEIAAKIQQIKTQMAQLNTKDGKERDYRKREDYSRRRNNGNGLLGNCPVSNYNGRVFGRGGTEDRHLSSAARAIVDSIRSMQAKNTYHQDNRRDYQRFDHKPERPEFRRRDRDDGTAGGNKADGDRPGDGPQADRYDARNRGLNVPVYRQPYLFRQMTPGTWCRRSPGAVHPVLNPQRRPHPDTRNPRR
ncbi:uncharacterized protein LOC118279781 isoform X3 [Spodoptera frugiperda]|uniref:Uncharacterized protein LOC118279781 isoform X3 n=1 Tax=Spodoptera frugiperda TaxID=7108 RepID=A0A9R0E3C2_SPOFR|nr:uncharacterized protein LOC118279781 isoform X3 [Spodoptera frugiperda]